MIQQKFYRDSKGHFCSKATYDALMREKEEKLRMAQIEKEREALNHILTAEEAELKAKRLAKIEKEVPGSVAMMIRKEAEIDPQVYGNDEDKILHNEICRKIRDIADDMNFPLGIIIYLGAATNGHKKEVFKQGYKTFNEKRARTVLKWLDVFAKHNDNPMFRANEKIAHALYRFYNKVSPNDDVFMQGVEKFPKTPASRVYCCIYATAREFLDKFMKAYPDIEI